jgi:endoglucanase
MWTGDTLFTQVGLGDGDGCSKICADHDLWRLPEKDDSYGGSKPLYRFIRNRPVFRAGPPGSRISPNLGGRLVADLALCSQVFHASRPAYAARCLRTAEQVFSMSDHPWKGRLVTAAQFDYYPETEWRDDLELGAVELARALQMGGAPSGLPHADAGYYLRRAAHWAHAYITGPGDGGDSLNLYDVSGLAHAELADAIQAAGTPGGLEVTRAQLVSDLRQQVAGAMHRGGKDPFGNGFPYPYDQVPHVFGLAVEAALYDRLTSSQTYAGFGTGELGYALGANAWGSSFVIGAGSTFPHCPQHQVANLVGSLDGTSPILAGATVAGPNAPSNFQGLGVPGSARPCPPGGGDAFARFSGHGLRYLDAVRAWPSVEPADDYTATAVLAFVMAANGSI